MKEHQLEITTPDGSMTTFEYTPDEAGKYPIVLYLMDAPGIRPALRQMAARLADEGYHVLLPFLYYRQSEYREFGASDEELHRRRDLMRSITREGALRDCDALLAHAANNEAVATDLPIGAVGFCMSGPLVLHLAQNRPERVGAIASVHGAWVVTDQPDSPHQKIDQITSEVYFAWADEDPTATAEEKAIMDDAMLEAGINYQIDFMSGALHGFAPPGGERYHHQAAEQHWDFVLDMFQRRLKAI